MSSQKRIDYWVELLGNADHIEHYNQLLKLMEDELTESECEEVLEILDETVET